jgi:hypothetical protein
MIRVDPITAAPDNTDRRVQFIVIVSIRPPVSGGLLLLAGLSSISRRFATKIPHGGSFRATPLGDRQRHAPIAGAGNAHPSYLRLVRRPELLFSSSRRFMSNRPKTE